MDIIEQAAAHVFEFLVEYGFATSLVSDTGTVDNLMNDGWTPTEIVKGKADDYILDNMAWL